MPTMPAPGTKPPSGADLDAPADPLLGLLVAEKYRITARVAKGGMGRIYLAEQIPLGRPVALKVLDGRDADSGREFEQRFFLEASTCARLTHPNTVTVFDYGRLNLAEGHTWYMVMEFIQGQTLRAVLRREGHFSPQRALRIAREIARSLREAHRLGVVHRDLKPTNVMLVSTEEGEAVKVLDFGIVKLLDGVDDDAELTRGGRLVGTPRYMAPEMVRRRAGGIDGRTDLYSLGMVLYEMLGGRVPFTGDTMDVALKQLQEPVPMLIDLTGVEVPEAVEAIARRCLEKRSEDRYADVAVFIEAVDAALAGLGNEPDRPVGIISRPTLDGRGEGSTLGRSRASRVGIASLDELPTSDPGPTTGGRRALAQDPGSLPDSGSLPEPTGPSVRRSGGRLGAALLLLLVAGLGAAAGLWWMNRGQPDTVTVTGAAVPESAPASTTVAQVDPTPDEPTPNAPPSAPEQAVASAPESGLGGGVAEHAPDSAAPSAPETPTSVAMVAPTAAPDVALPRRVMVRSRPKGAEVYDGEVLLGTTPVEVAVGAARRRLRLTRSGYESATLVLDQRSPDVTEKTLRRQAEKRVPPPDLDIRTTR